MPHIAQTPVKLLSFNI